MRLTIADLALGKAYKVQVQAVSGTEYGPWSPILDIPATNEVYIPAQPEPPTAYANTMQIQVIHNNLKLGGTASFEYDVVGYNVYAGTAPSPTTKIGFLNRGPSTNSVGSFPIPASNSATGATGQTWYVRVSALNSSKIESTTLSSDATANPGLVSSANISDLTATRITSGTISSAEINVGGATYINISGNNATIKSSNYSTGATGWAIKSDGTAEFNAITARGGFQTALSGRRITINSDSATPEKVNFYSGFTGNGFNTTEISPGHIDSDVELVYNEDLYKYASYKGYSSYQGYVSQKSSTGTTRTLRLLSTNIIKEGDPIAVYLNPSDSNYDSAYTTVTSSFGGIGPSFTQLSVASTSSFPSSGKALINQTDKGWVIISYTSKNSTTLLGVTTNLKYDYTVSSGDKVYVPYTVSSVDTVNKDITYTASTSYSQVVTAHSSSNIVLAGSIDYYRGVTSLVPPELVSDSETVSDPYVTSPYLKISGSARGNKNQYYRSEAAISSDRLDIYSSDRTYMYSYEPYATEIYNGLYLSGTGGLYSPFMRPKFIADTENAFNYSVNIAANQSSQYRSPDGGITTTTGATTITIPFSNVSIYADAIDTASPPSSNTAASFPTTTIAAASNGANLSSATSLTVANASSFPPGGLLTVTNAANQPQLVSYTGVSANTFIGCSLYNYQGSTGGTVATGKFVAPAILISIDNQNSLGSGFIYAGYTGTATSPTRFTGCYSYYEAVNYSGVTFNSRLYISTNNSNGVIFQAPYSGRVMISVGATLQAASAKMILGWSLKEGNIIGSGKQIYEGSENNHSAVVLSNGNAGNIYLMASSPNKIVTGLTGGAWYNVSLKYINTSTSAKAMDNVSITATPLP